MKILEDALSDEAFKYVTEGLDKLVIDHKQCWTSSALIWNSEVKRGVTGTTLITTVSYTHLTLPTILLV